MKIKLVETQPIDPREFDLPEKFSPKNIEDIAEIFQTPMTGHYNWDYSDADTRIKKLYELGKELNWDGSIDETKINPKEIPVFHTMETVDKVWGKLPRERKHHMFMPNYRGEFYHIYVDQLTRPKPHEILQMSNVLWTPEQLAERAERWQEEMDRQEVLDVKGIGEKTAEKLLKKFKTADGVFSATEKQISKISGLSKRANFIWRCLDSYNKTREKKSE